jgi:pimeloyl-ACP methyl ester carboxylesterase
MKSNTIVFIHGLFMNPVSWSLWVKYFENKGYKCYTPAYPFHDGSPETLRSSINSELGMVTFKQVIDNLIEFIDALPEKPVLIGHSMGGLAVQKLMSMNKGAVGIAIDPAPPKGIFSFKWSFLKSNLPTISPFSGNTVLLPDLNWFHYAFCNTMTIEQTETEYNKFVVPESRNIARSSVGKDGKIDFSKPHYPLLIIAGEKDNIVPASLVRKNFEAYNGNQSRTEFIEFAGRTHYICCQPNWEDIAIYIAGWIKSLV